MRVWLLADAIPHEIYDNDFDYGYNYDSSCDKRAK